MATQKKKRSLKSHIFRFTLKAFAWFFALTFLWVLALKWLPVVVTPLTVQRSIQHRKDEDFHTTLKWRSYEKISPELAKAVIASEDNLFDLHGGLDWVAISTAVTEHRNGKKLRGASTISQQTAKNVFCIPSRSFIRKGFEYYFTELIELLWGKRRIIEVYLNVAEMGPGIYGAEAAAQYHFKKSAKELRGRRALLPPVFLTHLTEVHPSHPDISVKEPVI